VKLDSKNQEKIPGPFRIVKRQLQRQLPAFARQPSMHSGNPQGKKSLEYKVPDPLRMASMGFFIFMLNRIPGHIKRESFRQLFASLPVGPA
jgi:hypothetical protein